MEWKAIIASTAVASWITMGKWVGWISMGYVNQFPIQ
jgi:hypothetical protein